MNLSCNINFKLPFDEFCARMQNKLKSIQILFAYKIQSYLTCHIMDRQRLLSLVRFYFIGLNGVIIIIAGIVLFILGKINFIEKELVSGSFIGGKLAAISILFIFYGALGAYGAVKNERVLIIIYASIAVILLITRLLWWVLAAMHGYWLKTSYYSYVVVELTIILMSALFNFVLKWFKIFHITIFVN